MENWQKEADVVSSDDDEVGQWSFSDLQGRGEQSERVGEVCDVGGAMRQGKATHAAAGSPLP